MFSKTRERLRLEDDLRECVQKTEIRYRWTAAASKSVLASIVPGQPLNIEAAAAIEKAVAAEQEALESYRRMLNMFTGLVVYGRMPRFRDRLQVLLTRALEATVADMGMLHIVNPEGGMIIETQSGFGPVLESFQRVGTGDCVCGEAFRTRQSVVVDDVEGSPLLEAARLRDALIAAGVRAVMSTPILAPGRALLGVLSVHYRRVTRPTPDQRMGLERLAGEAAGIIMRHQDADRATH